MSQPYYGPAVIFKCESSFIDESDHAMELTDVLRGGRQCDEDGVEIIMSRQACVEAADELDRLRAEVVSLQKENASLKEERDELIHMHSNDGHCIVDLTQQLAAVNSERDSWINEWKTSNKRCEELVGRIALQQEQLAAANGRVGEYREACEAALPYVEKAAKEHADDGYKNTPPIKALECIRAALTALPEADHSEHHLDMVADKEKS